MRALAAAMAFLTRIPVAGAGSFTAEDAGRAARWFPLVGLLLGAVWVLLLRLLAPRLPAEVIAVLMVLAEALLTGALHMDGLADTADGFGGGRTREEILRIMRDHAIGSYGAVALILLIALKVTVMGALARSQNAVPYLMLAPVLGRWSIVPLCRWLPYARETPSVASHIGTLELAWASVIAAGVAAHFASWNCVACWVTVCAMTASFGWFCRRRIGGITGDTLGANVQLSESVVLLAGLALG